MGTKQTELWLLLPRLQWLAPCTVTTHILRPLGKLFWTSCWILPCASLMSPIPVLTRDTRHLRRIPYSGCRAMNFQHRLLGRAHTNYWLPWLCMGPLRESQRVMSWETCLIAGRFLACAVDLHLDCLSTWRAWGQPDLKQNTNSPTGKEGYCFFFFYWEFKSLAATCHLTLARPQQTVPKIKRGEAFQAPRFNTSPNPAASSSSLFFLLPAVIVSWQAACGAGVGRRLHALGDVGRASMLASGFWDGETKFPGTQTSMVWTKRGV